MTRTNHILVFLFCALSTLLNAQNVTLGIRNGAGNSGVLMATNSIANSSNYSRAAAIYTAAEILAANGNPGEIRRLWWYQEGTGELTGNNTQIKVYLRHVSYASHSASSVTWATELVGDTVRVFDSSSWNIPTFTGWKEIRFKQPFVWNGTDNVQVLVEFNRSGTPITAISWANSSATLTPASSNANAVTTTANVFSATMSRNSSRPLIQFEIVNPLAQDAAVFKIVTPPATRAAGLDSVCVKVINRAQDLYSVDVDWEVNGVLQPGNSLSFNPPLAASDSSAVIKLGNYTFPSGNHLVRVWTKNPNNQPDTYRNNDTLTMNVWVPYTALSGTYTIDPSLPSLGTNFKNFTDAFRALNESGISSTVYFNAAANAVFNESNLLLTATGTATDSIVFRKNGTGNNPLIIAKTGTSSRDFIIGLEGSDYVVFDGINIQDTDPLNTSTTQQTEWGYALFRKTATDGAQHNIIRNCRIELKADRTSGVGIYLINATSAATLNATSAAGTNSFNHFHNDSIINCNTGISANGTTGFYDTDNYIGVNGGNVIQNFGTASSSNGAIHATQHNNTRISNNLIHSGSRTTALKGINTLAGVNSNLTVNNNTVTLITTSTSASFAITSATGSLGTNNSTNFYNNHIINCYTQGAFTGILSDALANQVNIYNNIIENDSFGSSGSIYLIDIGYTSGDNPGSINAYGNIIRNIKRAASTSTLYGFYSGQLIAGVVTRIYDNQVYNITNEGNTGTVSGIHVYGPSSLTYHHVYRNQVYNISNLGTGVATGINLTGADGLFNGYAYNNFISGIKAPYSSNANATIGINATIKSSYIGLYYNTIYLSDSVLSATSTYGSAGISVNSATLTDLRNNIIINKSVPGNNGGIVAAYKRSTSVLNTYSDSSNNNILYTGSVGNRRYIFYDGTDSALTVGSFKGKMATRDQSSLGTLPQFINTTAVPYDLHIDATVATPVESAGTPVFVSGVINTDFDGDSRNAQNPDIGADEGNFISGDFEGPSISFTRLKNTSNAANRIIDVIISDPSGVDSSVSGRPQIYYRKNASSFISAPAVSRLGNTFTFEINHTSLGGVFVNDVVEYYIGAQDLSSSGNVSTSPEGGFGAFPPGYYPPSELASYSILQPLTGQHYVGTSIHFPPASYATLKDALLDYKVKGLTGPVEFILIDTLYSTATGETLPITIDENPDASSVNTLTIKPETGVHVRMEDVSAYRSSIVKMNGSDYVTIDGLNRDNTSLTIINQGVIPDSDSMNAVIWISSAGANNGANYNTIKNCNVLGFGPSQTKIGIFSGTAMGTGLGQFVEANNNGTVIDSNYIARAHFGILMIGSSLTNPALKNRISHNTIGGNGSGEGLYLAGIQLTRQDSAEVSDNHIQNIYGSEISNSDGDRYGINLWNTKNSTIRSNRIHDMHIGGSAATEIRGISSTALAYKTSGLPSNNVFVNNVIYDLTHAHYAVNVSVAGINLSDGYGDKVYYNTVYLTGQLATTSLGASAALSMGYSSIIGNSPVAGTNMDIRNNILAITGNYGSDATTKRVYAYYSKGTSLTGSILNNNVLYANGSLTARSAIGRLNNTDYITLADWRTITGAEANSTDSDPLLNSPVIPIPYNNSPALGAGTPIAGITTDIEGTLRNASTPSIGAYETGRDFGAPVISLNLLKNTSSTANLTTTDFARITDNSGVNITAGTKPRLYFKKSGDLNAFNGNTSIDNGWKWVETSSIDTPFNFTIDYSLLPGGSVSVNDTIQYFVVAQDNSPLINVGSSAVLSDTPVSVNLSASSFPAAFYHSYRILPQTSGYVSVGAGQTYTSLTNDGGLFDALKNSMILSGDVTVLITSDLAETGTHELSTWQEDGAGNYKITFRPDHTFALRTISGNAANGLIRLNGAKKVLFDGIDTVLNYGQFLQFVNTSATGPVFSWLNNATSDTVRNCIIQGDNASTSSGLMYIGSGGNIYNEISNNQISNRTGVLSRYANAVYASGTNANPNNNNNILYNRISNFSNNGITISSTGNTANWKVVGNHLYDSAVGAATTSQTGISVSLSSSGGHRIDSNYIGGSTIAAGGNKWLSSGNNSFDGITAALGAGSTVHHNIITNIARDNQGSSAAFTGISISGGSPDVRYNVIGDTVVPRAITLAGAAVLTGIEVTSGTQVTIQNNQVANIATDSAVNTRLRGISITASGSSSQITVSNNRVSDLFTLSSATSMTAGAQALTGIYGSGTSGSAVIHRNLIYNLQALRADTSTSTVAAAMVINKANCTISANRIYGIRNLAPRNVAVPSTVAGILLLANSGNALIINNMISLGHDTTDNIRYAGIWNYATAGEINMLHNSIALFGAASDTVPSYVLWRGANTSSAITTPFNAINNILFSERIGTAYMVANTSTSPANGWGAQLWNNNVFVTNNSVTFGLWGTSNAADLASWKTASLVDTASIQHFVYFINHKTAELNLVSPSVGDVILAGRPNTGITSDFDGETRNVTPYAGADENTAFPVPVKLTSFNAVAVNRDVLVSWITASEKNVAQFIVEVSADGKRFEQAGKVKAIGNSSTPLTYKFMHTDARLVMNGATVLYYRLTSIDQDGSSTTSQVAIVRFDDKVNTLDAAVAYPNPFNRDVTLSIPASAAISAEIVLIDLQGKVLGSEQHMLESGSNEIALKNLEMLKQGIYFVKITTPGETKVIKLVKE